MSDYKSILPPVYDEMQISLPHFPTRMQALIFRLWEMVSAAKLAQILKTGEETVRTLAEEMGLPPQGDTAIWMKSGYITIIRAAWQLLPYEQLLELLDWDAEQLAFTLREDDFLRSKLGNGKFCCDPVVYAPLTPEQREATARIRAVMEKNVRVHDREIKTAPFAFFPEAGKRVPAARPADCPVDLREDWQIADESGDARTGEFIADFREDMARWGVDFDGSTHQLTVRLDPALAADGDETHRVQITENAVTVTGAAPVGVLRGLSLLCTLADASGGPFFRTLDTLRKPAFDTRFIYSYCGLFGSVLDTDTAVSYPDELLRAYARTGVNGVWLQAVLYKVTRFPFDPSISEGWEQRQENLRRLVTRAARYGIRVFLYINEPRAMPLSFFETRPELRGHVRDESASLCTSHPAVQAYLRDSITDLCTAVPGLGGFFTISVSENQTNCYSHAYEPGHDCHVDDVIEQNCPHCLHRRPWEVVAEANSLIADAAHAVDPSIKTFVWTWGWGRMGREGMLEAIRLLSPNCTVQNTSEERMDVIAGGVKSILSDYTLSRIPPSPQSRESWSHALATGHATSAKVQLNCTWEASTAPYIPVYENILEHIRRLREIGVGNLQLSWTLGGWPSENLKIASSFFFADPSVTYSYDEALRSSYGEHAPAVKAAVHAFCEAFAQFPFYVISLYRGPQNAGPANLLFSRPTGLTSTTTCYAYDDLENWRSIYPVEIYTEQFRLVAEGWQKGLRLLDSMPDCDFKDTARVCGALFCASYNQIRFVQTRDAYLAHPSEELRRELLSLIADEKRIAEEILVLMYRDARIGYEAANHYLFSRTSLMEKIVNCDWLETVFA